MIDDFSVRQYILNIFIRVDFRVFVYVYNIESLTPASFEVETYISYIGVSVVPVGGVLGVVFKVGTNVEDVHLTSRLNSESSAENPLG